MENLYEKRNNLYGDHGITAAMARGLELNFLL